MSSINHQKKRKPSLILINQGDRLRITEHDATQNAENDTAVHKNEM
jgi:hypothetical protein